MYNNLVKIPEYPEYLINTNGEVFSEKSNRFLRCRTQTSGYLFFSVSVKGIQTNLLLHRVLARVFLDLGSLDSIFEVDHINKDKIDNNLSNLQVLSKDVHNLKTTIDSATIRNSRCDLCKNILHKNTKSKLCKECNTSKIPLEDIEYWVINFSWVRASKELGLSDNGLRKRYKKLTGKDPKLIKS